MEELPIGIYITCNDGKEYRVKDTTCLFDNSIRYFEAISSIFRSNNIIIELKVRVSTSILLSDVKSIAVY